MKFSFKNSATVCAIAVCALLSATTAKAVPTLYVNGSAVASGASPVTFNNTIGNFMISLTGMVGGTPQTPTMLFHFAVTTTAAGAGAITLAFAADSFGPTSAIVAGTSTGNGVSTAAFSALASNTNTHLTGATLFASSPLSGANYTGMYSSGLNLPAPYALTEFVTLNFSTAGTSSGDLFIRTTSVPDAGGTLALLGLAIAGLGALRRKFVR